MARKPTTTAPPSRKRKKGASVTPTTPPPTPALPAISIPAHTPGSEDGPDWTLELERPWEPPATPAPDTSVEPVHSPPPGWDRFGGTGQRAEAHLAPESAVTAMAQVDVAPSASPLAHAAEGGRSPVRRERKSDRFDFRVAVDFSTVGRADSAWAHNLSSQGMFVHTLMPLEAGDPVTVNFAAPDGGSGLTLYARVKWVTLGGGGHGPDASGMGLEFVGVDDKKRRTLTAIIARLRLGRPL